MTNKNKFIIKLSRLALAFGCVLLMGCESAQPACYLGAPEISVNGAVAANEPIVLEILDNGNINLSTDAFDGFEYLWTGPNGFQSEMASPTIPNATNANSGTYTLTATKGICSGTATANIEVSAVVVPCAPVNNRITFTNGANPVNFNSVSAYVTQDVFQINANGSGGDLTIEFANDNEPETGEYEINTDCPTSFLTAGQVCVSMVYASQWRVAQGGTVFVTKMANGKYTATFCDVVFSPSSPFPGELKGSAKVTEL